MLSTDVTSAGPVAEVAAAEYGVHHVSCPSSHHTDPPFELATTRNRVFAPKLISCRTYEVRSLLDDADGARFTRGAAASITYVPTQEVSGLSGPVGDTPGSVRASAGYGLARVTVAPHTAVSVTLMGEASAPPAGPTPTHVCGNEVFVASTPPRGTISVPHGDVVTLSLPMVTLEYANAPLPRDAP